MAITINTNVDSLTAQKNLNSSMSKLIKNFQSLSSGKRINSAADDAAGLAISANLTAEVKSLQQATRNSYDAVSVTQIADGGMENMSENIGRMRELAMQAANGSYSDSDRALMQQEFSQIKQEVDRVASSTEYNGQKLLDGSSPSMDFQVGSGVGDQVSVNLPRISTAELGKTSTSTTSVADTSISTAAGAQAALATLDKASQQINRQRASLGAAQNVFSSTINNLENKTINVSAANSRIQDADIAQEVSKLTQNQIMTQAGAQVLGQANMTGLIALKLLK